MQTFYVTHDEFWDWFDRQNDDDQVKEIDHLKIGTRIKPKQRGQPEDSFNKPLSPGTKRFKTDGKPKSIFETEALSRGDSRYIIMYGRHKPGKKNKTWEGDGYLTMVGQVAHVCDLRGKMLEEPTLLDDIDYKLVEDLSELTIGNTEVQVLEIDKT